MAEKIFDSSNDGGNQNESRKKNRPILENNSEGAAAWLNRDKNGNAYVSVKLPLGLGSLSLFAANDEVADALNQFADHLDEQD